MTITCALGIELYKAYQNGADPTAILCKLKGVSSPDQLTRAELMELTELSNQFNRTALIPKDINDISIEFTLGEYYVNLGQFSELDITVQALELLEGFNPGELERLPVMLGCIYAPIVRAMFELTEPVAKVAAKVADAIRNQIPFSDVYAVYDFFVSWKEISTRVPSPSFKHSMSNYQLQRVVLRPTRLLIDRSLTRSHRRSGKIMRAIRNSTFIVNMSVAILNRWLWLTMASLREWWRKKRTK